MTAAGSHWDVFRTALLRSAGFPFEWLDGLASQELERLGTRLLVAHARREDARTVALRDLWPMRARIARADMPMLNRAIRRVRSRKPVAGAHTDIIAATSAWNMAVADVDSLSAELSGVLAAEHDREIRILLNHVTSPHFMDAVLLSSPSAYEEFCRTARSRRFHHGHELVAYRFLQRFTAKNETGGAIGPLNLLIAGQATDGKVTASERMRYVDDPVLGRLEYLADGDGRSAMRRTFLSYWAACEIGRSLIEYSPGARYARQPYRLFPEGTPEPTAADARLLSRVDGQTTVSALAGKLDLPVETVSGWISRLAGLGLVADNWRVPYFTTDPGEDLRTLAERIGTPEATSACQLLADVTAFATAPPQERPVQLSVITREFSRLTHKPAWRGAGQLMADRAVFHEEATGNIRAARIGSEGVQRLAERLSAALEFLASLAIEERAAGQSLLARELAKRNAGELPATEVRRMKAAAPADHSTLTQRFLGLLDASVPYAEFSRRDLSEAGLIRGDLEDWPLFGAADLMLAGAGGDSIILSELHHIWPTLACQVRALYADSELANQELWQIVARELAPALPTMQEIDRHEKGTDSSPFGHTVLCLDTGMPVPGAETIPANRLVVRPWRSGFIGLHDPVTARDLWLLPEYDDTGVDAGGLINCAIPALSLTPFIRGPHTPRIVIDGVVIQRRRWEIAATDFPDASGRSLTGPDWLAVQRWRRDLGLPRCGYFLLDTEDKPVYLDFASVLSVANFLRCLPRAGRLALTEALPDPRRLWLRTGQESTLTSEIRTLVWRDRGTRP